MSRAPAKITQADVRRVIRAAKLEGVAELEVRVGASSVIVRLASSTAQNEPIEDRQEIVL